LEEPLSALKEGRSTHMAYETTFTIYWPEHLGAGVLSVDFDGTMVLVPILST
jgi:hypothetical protein